MRFCKGYPKAPDPGIRTLLGVRRRAAELVEVVGVDSVERAEQGVARRVVAPVAQVDAAQERPQLALLWGPAHNT